MRKLLTLLFLSGVPLVAEGQQSATMAPTSAPQYEVVLKRSQFQGDPSKLVDALNDIIKPNWRSLNRQQQLITKMNVANWLQSITRSSTSVKRDGEWELTGSYPNENGHVVLVRRFSIETFLLSTFGSNYSMLADRIAEAAIDAAHAKAERDTPPTAVVDGAGNVHYVKETIPRPQIDQSARDTLVDWLKRVPRTELQKARILESTAEAKRMDGGDLQIRLLTPKPVIERPRDVQPREEARLCPRCGGSGEVYRSVGRVRPGEPSRIESVRCPACGGTGRAR